MGFRLCKGDRSLPSSRFHSLKSEVLPEGGDAEWGGPGRGDRRPSRIIHTCCIPVHLSFEVQDITRLPWPCLYDFTKRRKTLDFHPLVLTLCHLIVVVRNKAGCTLRECSCCSPCRPILGVTAGARTWKNFGLSYSPCPHTVKSIFA